MARQSHGKAARARQIAAASGAVLATLVVGGCERQADADAPRDHAQLTYQLSVSLAQAPSVAMPMKVALPIPTNRSPMRTELARVKAVPSMPAPTMAPPVAFVLDIPPPAAAARAALPTPAVLPAEREPALAVAHEGEPAPATADANSELAAVTSPLKDRLVYIPQISESDRAAYIAQVDAGAHGQRMAVRSGDQVLGAVEFQVADGVVAVNIGQVLDLFQGRMDGAEFAQLRASSAAQSFVSLDQLQSAGIPLEYNAAYDELMLGTARG